MTSALAAGLVLTSPFIGQRALAAAPTNTGQANRRLLIKGATVISMDPAVGEFEKADILIIGDKIVEIAPAIQADDTQVIDADRMIAIPGFIDTHHHQFETALRSVLADGLLVPDGKPHGELNYFDLVIGKFTGLYRPEDVYISELFGALSQLDAGVTTVHDVSQIHHSPEHTDAAYQGIVDSGRRTAMGYVEGTLEGARRAASRYFSSNEGLVSMVMGGEIFAPGHEGFWALGRELGLPIALHVVGTLGLGREFDRLAAAGSFGPDNIFIHMTGMSDMAWNAARDAGASLSLAVPIEMTMRHGLPPIAKALELGFAPSLSTDVETTMTADFFTQMRSVMTLQRALVNEGAIAGDADLPELLTARDVLGFATNNGAKALHLSDRTGSLTPGKQADIVLLDAGAINVAPLNHAAGSVVTMMERSNVDTVLVAGKIRKWQGKLLGADLPKLRSEIEASRDYLFQAAGLPHDLFR